MSHSWDCPSEYEARRKGYNDHERGYGHNPYRGDGWEPGCEEAERAYDRGRRMAEYDHEERMMEERRAQQRAEAARHEQEQEEQYWQEMQAVQYPEQPYPDEPMPEPLSSDEIPF